ncbi:uncharacterized protein SPAPADRAFT_61995 [Spathaspora passalidarum NRRL Y-27907]|uniref:CBS domain-containing protein n=1 Tax=Spathaspora passalidarum (strain NRRL Y-27907 / 11-Y1) TaxID=619300 RepID=G3AQ85_SPAPN|nr:uncharacterized protein SPAPADRAFT_61995 [Spathaspora passalidarum NRRL Y-27907]EGW31432.1 hypothetical protein SPAPADRAFT_61995 [Spathaspora passalidarum NRRL Y-27907]
MTPMDRVYTMSADTILDEKTVEEIFNAGFSRIPIHLPNEPNNFIGMLLVRVLISYDPEDALPVAAFPLATLPETALDTSCLNILNYFQEGKSHMIVVSEHPGEPVGARGVLTLEDVIEELIGEEIVDESDVYIDINKKIKRKQPGPLSKRNLTSYLHTLYQRSAQNSKRNSLDSSYQPDLRERLSQPQINNVIQTTPKDNVKPKNPAQNPLETNKKFVTIKKPVDQNTLDNVTKAVSPVPFGSSSATPAPASTLQPSQDAYGAVYSTEKGALVEAQRRSFEGERYSHTHEDKRDLPHYHVPNIGSRTASSSSVKKNPARFLLPEERETDVSEIHEESHGRQEHEHGDHHDDHEQDGIKHYHGSPDHSLVSPVGIPTTETSSAAGLAIPQSQESRSYRTGGIIESVVNVQGVHKTIIENVSDEELQYEQMLHERQLAKKNFSTDDIDNAIQDGDEESEGLLNNGRRHSSGTNGNGRRMSLWEKIRGASQSPSEH